MSWIDWIRSNEIKALIIMGGAIAVLALLVVIQEIRLQRTNRRYRRLMLGADKIDLSALMTRYTEAARTLSARLDAVEGEARLLAETSRYHIQKVALSRYNAFDHSGSDLSFTLVMMNEVNDGVLVTSIFGRDETRVYAKPISGGKSTYHLSEEETEAIRQALKPKSRV